MKTRAMLLFFTLVALLALAAALAAYATGPGRPDGWLAEGVTESDPRTRTHSARQARGRP